MKEKNYKLIKLKYSESFKWVCNITIVYFTAHFFLFVLSGKWWDDWVYSDKNWDYLYDVMKQCSVPLDAYVYKFLWVFPDDLCRILTFLLYYFSVLLFYLSIVNIGLINRTDCGWIALLFSVIPINDARVMWVCFSYALGFFFFFLAAFFTTMLKRKVGRKRLIIRSLSIFFLFIAFSFLQSSMMLVIPLLCYLYYSDLSDEWSWKQNGNIKKIIMTIVRHGDYLLAPIIWYFGDKILFPGYGVYGGVYYVRWKDVPRIVIESAKWSLITAELILQSYFKVFKDSIMLRIIILVAIIFVAINLFFKNKSNKQQSTASYLYYCLVMVSGMILYYLGYFPYALRMDDIVKNTYIPGRNAILLGIGVSLVIFSICRIVFNDEVSKVILVTIIVAGILHFNQMYLDWQECYYQQLQFQSEIKHNNDIKNGNTFITMYRGDIIYSGFSQSNGNSYAATGEQTRLFMQGAEGLTQLIDMTEDSWCLNAYCMRDYDYRDKIVDGIIFVNYNDIGRRTLVNQKLNEMFDQEAFEAWINNIKDIKYVKLSKPESDKLIDICSEGYLTDEVIYGMFLHE